MAVLTWKHGKTKQEAVDAIQAAIQELGFTGHVTWSAAKLTAQYRLLFVLVDACGEVTDEKVFIERSDGKLGGVILNKCHELLERLFPGGKQNG